MSTALPAPNCHSLKTDETAAQFLTKKEDYGWPQILDYKETVKITHLFSLLYSIFI